MRDYEVFGSFWGAITLRLVQESLTSYKSQLRQYNAKPCKKFKTMLDRERTFLTNEDGLLKFYCDLSTQSHDVILDHIENVTGLKTHRNRTSTLYKKFIEDWKGFDKNSVYTSFDQFLNYMENLQKEDATC